MRKYSYKVLIAATCILLMASFKANSPVPANAENTHRRLTDSLLVDSLGKLIDLDSLKVSLKKVMEMNTAAGAPIYRRMGRRRSPNEKFVEWTARSIPWDGKSEVYPDSIYLYAPELEEKFLKAYFKALIPANLPNEVRNGMKNSILEVRQGGFKLYIQELDSIYQYRDSLYKTWKNIDIDSL